MKKTVVIAILLSIASFTFYFFNGMPWNLYKFTHEFEQYLEERYEKDFVIEDISFDFFHGTYHASAYEKGEPNLSIYVGQNMRDEQISDSYEFERTTIQAKEEIRSIIAKYIDFERLNVELISLTDKEIEVNIWLKEEINDDLKNEIKAEILKKGYKTDQVFFNMNQGF